MQNLSVQPYLYVCKKYHDIFYVSLLVQQYLALKGRT